MLGALIVSVLMPASVLSGTGHLALELVGAAVGAIFGFTIASLDKSHGRAN